MKFIFALGIFFAVIFVVLFVLVVIGVPEEIKETKRIISTDNMVDGANYRFIEKEFQKPFYHYGFERYTYKVSYLYYVENKENLEINNLNTFPAGFRVQYAKYHNKINKWVVLLCPMALNDKYNSFDGLFIHLFLFTDKNKIEKSVFVGYQLPNSKKIDFDVDEVEEKITYYDKDLKMQKIELK